MAAEFAPPVRKGDFLYSSVLYADAGNNNHPRASTAELAALLRPEAPKLYTGGRKPDGSVAPSKDPAWHFYSAQLIHYGLPVTKDKNAAKVRLLNAMNQFKLEVPTWVAKMEGELKNEWEAENRKTKKKRAISETKKSARGSKGSQSRNVHGGGFNSGASQDVSRDLKVMINVSVSSSVGSRTEPFSIPQSTSKNSRGASKPASTKRKRTEPINHHPDSPKPKKITKAKSESTPKKIKKEPISKPRIKRESSRPASPPYQTPPRIKPDPYIPSPPHFQPNVLISGAYTVTPTSTTPYYDSENFILVLYRSSVYNSNIWWATISWGPFSGLIRMNPGPSTLDSFDRALSLGWRLRDEQDNSLRFGRACVGEMSFSLDHSFQGILWNVPDVGTIEMQGERMPGPALEGDFQDEWDGFVEEAYRR